ncbi:MAG: hypothetical protein R2849_12275 [Thermomicrobiales bacterium]
MIGDAGLIFNEDDSGRRGVEGAGGVAGRLREMQQAGRQRVLERFTQEQVANQTWQLYRKILGIDEGIVDEDTLDPEAAARLLEPGPLALLTSRYRSTENVMTQAWMTTVSLDPAVIAVAIHPCEIDL